MPGIIGAYKKVRTGTDLLDDVNGTPPEQLPALRRRTRRRSVYSGLFAAAAALNFSGDHINLDLNERPPDVIQDLGNVALDFQIHAMHLAAMAIGVSGVGEFMQQHRQVSRRMRLPVSPVAAPLAEVGEP